VSRFYLRSFATILLFLVATLSAATLPESAQDWPTRPIRALTTASPGGISDVFMRALGERLRERLGPAIVVEKSPRRHAERWRQGLPGLGAGRLHHLHHQCRSDHLQPVPDKDMPFDPEHGLQPITKLFDLIHVMVVNAELKVKTVDELIALSKQKPGTLSYLTPGAPMVLYMETLKKERGADWVRVPFKGGGEAVNAILSGFTPIGLFGEGNVIGQIRAGTMTPLVMLNNIHSPNFPKVPTLKETGYNGPPSRGWYGLFAPAGTPRPIVDRLAKEVAAIVAEPNFAQKQLKDCSLVGATNTPDAFAAEIVEDRKVAEQVVKAAGIAGE